MRAVEKMRDDPPQNIRAALTRWAEDNQVYIGSSPQNPRRLTLDRRGMTP